MELCTRRILVQNEQIELTWVYLYPFNADVSRNTNYGHNHYPVSFFKSLIQALHAYRAKGKVGKSKMAEHSCCNIPYFGMCLLSLKCAYLCLLLPCAYFSKLCLLVPTFPMCLLSLKCAYLCLLLPCAYFPC